MILAKLLHLNENYVLIFTNLHPKPFLSVLFQPHARVPPPLHVPFDASAVQLAPAQVVSGASLPAQRVGQLLLLGAAVRAVVVFLLVIARFSVWLRR